jgi:hypothetical protein
MVGSSHGEYCGCRSSNYYTKKHNEKKREKSKVDSSLFFIVPIAHTPGVLVHKKILLTDQPVKKSGVCIDHFSKPGGFCFRDL